METDHVQARNNSLISGKTLAICIAVVAIALLAVAVFKIPLSTVAFAGILLACPLLHLIMMKDGQHKH